ncbi:MAG TPA: hypothetical protein VE983_05080, partial [Solirubrobacteraceae bacterium]|nr:hypothetical protein [Solirubrobacteraceae bacterium]
ELELPVGEWGGQVGSFLASDVRAGLARICELLASRDAISAPEAADLLRRSTLEFEEHHTVWPMAIAFGHKPNRETRVGMERMPHERLRG